MVTNGLKLGSGDGAAWGFFSTFMYNFVSLSVSTCIPVSISQVLGWAQGLAPVLQQGWTSGLASVWDICPTDAGFAPYPDMLPSDPLQPQQDSWLSLVDKLNVKAFVSLTLAPSVRHGVRQLLFTSGLGKWCLVWTWVRVHPVVSVG